MGKIIRNATPKQEYEFIEERRKFAFLAASKLFPRWLATASRHKRAADFIYEIAHTAFEREISRTLKKHREVSAEMGKKGLSSHSYSWILNECETNDYLDTELLSEYFLLSGYALECILKGCLIAKRPELVKDDRVLNNTITHHDLIKLCSDCGISLKPMEKQLLRTLIWHMDWGKYPVPKDSKHMPSPVEPKNMRHEIPGSPFHDRKAQKLINSIYIRVCDLYEQLRQTK